MFNLKFRKPSTKFFLSFSILIIAGFSILLFLGAILMPSFPVGESDDYMLSTISLENRFSLFIFPSDIEQAKSDFPEHMWSWQNYVLMKTDYPGILHPHYFGTYSLSCIPMKILLKHLGSSQTHAFSLTNALLYIISLLVVFFKLKLPREKIFWAILLLTCNPALFYIWWPSAEIFIFSLVVISLVYFSNNEHKQAALFVSIASTVQPTVIILGIAFFIDYIFSSEIARKNRQTVDILKTIKNIALNILKISFFYIPAILPMIYFSIYFKNVNPTTGMASFSDYWPRYISYLFDLNFGLLPYFNINLILFFILLIIGLIKLNFKSYIYTIGFFGVIAAYSVASHMNCGMVGIARYNIWVYPIAIIYLVSQYDVIIKSSVIKNIFVFLMVVSAFLTLTVVKAYGIFGAYVIHHTNMTPIAEKVLDTYPELYNPFHTIFISRVNHIDGEYIYDNPVIYKSPDGYVKKVLVTPETVSLLIKMLYGKVNEMKLIQNKIEKIQKEKEGFYYINFHENDSILLNYFWNGPLNFPSTDLRLETQTGIRSNGNLIIQALGHPGYFVNGPNMELNGGIYKLIVKGKLHGERKSLGSIEFIDNNKARVIARKEISAFENPDDSIITVLEFILNENLTNASFRIFTNDSVKGFFKEAELVKLNLSPQELIEKNDVFTDQFGRRYQATLKEGIDFTRSDLPAFIKSIKGLSGPESWGRWSDSKLNRSVEIMFYKPLPASFKLIIRAQAFGPNSGKPIKILIGDHFSTLTFSNTITEQQTDMVNKGPVFRIEFIPPFPKSPLSLGLSEDSRELGIGIERISIIEK